MCFPVVVGPRIRVGAENIRAIVTMLREQTAIARKTKNAAWVAAFATSLGGHSWNCPSSLLSLGRSAGRRARTAYAVCTPATSSWPS